MLSGLGTPAQIVLISFHFKFVPIRVLLIFVISQKSHGVKSEPWERYSITAIFLQLSMDRYTQEKAAPHCLDEESNVDASAEDNKSRYCLDPTISLIMQLIYFFH